MSDLKLSPCPFCGGAAMHIPLNHVIGCQPCGVWMSQDRKDEWNRRIQPEVTAPAQDLSAAAKLQEILTSVLRGTRLDAVGNRDDDGLLDFYDGSGISKQQMRKWADALEDALRLTTPLHKEPKCPT